MIDQGGVPLLEVANLVKHYPAGRRTFKHSAPKVRAVDGVSFSIDEGQTLGLVGESGCGKSTTARTTLRLVEPTAGSVRFGGREVTKLGRAELRELRREMQMVFQDPYASLDPRMTVRRTLEEPLKAHGIYESSGGAAFVDELIGRVGLHAEHADRYPHQFSGGQRQRIGLARALALHPKLIVCDEPVSKLDVSVQAQIINLLEDLQDELGLTYLFVAHDLSVVRHISDRVAVMYLGQIVEIAGTQEIFASALHPYTRALLSAIPSADPQGRNNGERIILRRDPPDPVDPPTGCRFHPRCPHAGELAASRPAESVTARGRPGTLVPKRCAEEVPMLRQGGHEQNHLIACHFFEELDGD